MPSLVDAILTPQVVEKQSPIVGAESATCELEVDFAAPGVACPDQGQLELERIAELACSAETQLGFPEDVEWAFALTFCTFVRSPRFPHGGHAMSELNASIR